MIQLYNTLTRRKEIFKPLKRGVVKMYTCGPTVYWFAHIGNLRTYIFEDLLKRMFEYNGYKVIHVMNITDVGHLVGDQNLGEDKMVVAAKREKKSVWEIARFYERAFKKDLKLLNIKPPSIWVRATETIKEQIQIIKKLYRRGLAYKIDDGIYFDSSKLKHYGRLWPPKMKILPGARVEMVLGKRNPTDFALWKFSKEKREMEWDSPWGKGFPGWHTECVAMGKKFLGVPFDIHCGGVDHILIHHTNEIAQSEGAWGKILARYWLHGEFLLVEKKKMAKSKGNIFRLQDIIDRGFPPLSFRYLCLTTHYRSKLNFTWEAISSAQNALKNLYEKVGEIRQKKGVAKLGGEALTYKELFLKKLNDDLNLPGALALMWKLLGEDRISNEEKYSLIIDFDRVFGLKLEEVSKPRIPKEIRELAFEREKLRKEKKFDRADEIRKKLAEMGYLIEDTLTGPVIKRKR